MFELKVNSHFSAAHSLIGYNGECSNMHGHNYMIFAVAKCETLDEIGLGIDFKLLKKHLNSVVDPLDHTNLNNAQFFRENKINTSSENIAKYIFDELSKKLENTTVILKEITVKETEGSSVTYYP